MSALNVRADSIDMRLQPFHLASLPTSPADRTQSPQRCGESSIPHWYSLRHVRQSLRDESENRSPEDANLRGFAFCIIVIIVGFREHGGLGSHHLLA